MDNLFWNFYRQRSNIAFADNFPTSFQWRKIEILLERKERKDEYEKSALDDDFSRADENLSYTDDDSAPADGIVAHTDDDFGFTITDTKRDSEDRKRKSFRNGEGASGGDGANKMLCVKSIKKGGPAHREGTLQVGDHILKINGMREVSINKANQLLQQPTSSLSLLIQYQSIKIDFRTAHPRPILGRILNSKNICNCSKKCCFNTNGYNNIGITIVTHRIRDIVCYMKKLSANDNGDEKKEDDEDESGEDEDDDRVIVSVDQIYEASHVDRTGLLSAGDRILEVNGVSVDYMSLPHICHLLSSTQTMKTQLNQTNNLYKERCKKQNSTHDESNKNDTNEKDRVREKEEEEDCTTILFIPQLYHALPLHNIGAQGGFSVKL